VDVDVITELSAAVGCYNRLTIGYASVQSLNLERPAVTTMLSVQSASGHEQKGGAEYRHQKVELQHEHCVELN
jgi:hypothetical protein